ncbi:MAG: RbsD/FucU family protein [Alphaproteobacteria bacterium]
MLKGLPAMLGPDLLSTLRAMGHGDEIAIVDANYPADAHATRLVRMDGHDVPAIADALLSVLPLDRDVDAAFRPCAHGDCDRMEPVYSEFDALLARHEPGIVLRPLPGDGFYARVRGCYAIIASGERRLFANIILRKGVIGPVES